MWSNAFQIIWLDVSYVATYVKRLSFLAFVRLFFNTCRIKSLFPYKDPLNRSQTFKLVYTASCWDCDDFYIGKTKRRLQGRKTEHLKALAKQEHKPAVPDRMKGTGRNTKWDHFEVLASGKANYHCNIKEKLFKQELNPTLNTNVTSDKLSLF